MDLIITLDIIGLSFAFAFIVVHIVSPAKTKRAKAFIISGFILLSLLLIQNMTVLWGDITTVKIMLLICFPMYFLLYPLIYIYLNYLASETSEIKLTPSHFLPALFVMFAILFIYVVSPQQFSYELTWTLSNYTTTNGNSFWILGVPQVIYYSQFVYFLFLYTKLYQKVKTNPLTKFKASWFKLIIIFVILYEAIYFTVWIITNSVFIADILLTDAAILILGVISLKHEQILFNLRIEQAFEKNPRLNIERKVQSKFSMDEKRELFEELRKIIIDDKLYICPNLKLNTLARKLHIPEKELSIIINDLAGQNFSSFVNKYRIEEACELLKNSNIKISDLPLKVGFYSRSAFTNKFKELVGETPSSFRENLSSADLS